MIEPAILTRILARFQDDYRLVAASPLAGGVSAQVIRLVVQSPTGAPVTLLLRWHDRPGPAPVTREYELLRWLHQAGLPVPHPRLLDTSGALLPYPYMVLAYVEGYTDFKPANLPDYLDQSAAALAALQRARLDADLFARLPNADAQIVARLGARPVHLDASLREGAIRDRLEAAWPWPANSPTLLHGDFWPGNLIWQAGQLVAVIDWEDAAIGDPLLDLAICRLELCFAFGADAMSDFTRRYTQHIPGLTLTCLPYWDLYAALRPMHQLADWALGWADFGRPDVTEASMRRAHQAFVRQAFDQLPAT